MTTAQVVEMSVTNNRYVTRGFKPFTYLNLAVGSEHPAHYADGIPVEIWCSTFLMYLD